MGARIIFLPFNTSDPSFNTSKLLNGEVYINETDLDLGYKTSSGTIVSLIKNGSVAAAMTLANARTISATGDITFTTNAFNGSANVTGIATLSNSGVAAGTYTKVTVDTKGRVTAATNIGAGDLPSNLALAGVPTAPTAVAGTNTTQIATTAFVLANISAGAEKLTVARTIAISGDATGSTTFDGSANATINITLGNSGVAAGTYDKVTVDAKGRVTAGSSSNANDIVFTPSGNIAATTVGGALVELDAEKLSVSGVAASSTKLATARTIALGGDATGSTTFDGTLDKTITVTLSNSGVVAGTYAKVTVDAKGRVTGSASLISTDLPADAALSGIPTAATATVGTNTTQIATTAFVLANMASVVPLMDGAAAVGTSTRSARADHVHPSDSSKISMSLMGAVNGVATLDSNQQLNASQFPSSILEGLVYKGIWNASTNVPSLVSSVGTKGWYYKVTTAGSTSIDGQSGWTVGDWIVFNGLVWDRVQGGESDVSSVAGRTGAVTLTKTDVGLANLDNIKQLPHTQTLTVTGDVVATATALNLGSIALTLSNSGVAAGTYVKVTVDAKGRVTAGGSLSFNDIPKDIAATANTIVARDVSASFAANTIMMNNAVIGAGTAGLPSVAVGPTNQGMYSVSALKLGFSVEGVLALDLTKNAANFAGAVTAVNFIGNGVSITALNAGNITTGTLTVARGGTGVTTKTGTGNVVLSADATLSGITSFSELRGVTSGIKLTDGVSFTLGDATGSFLTFDPATRTTSSTTPLHAITPATSENSTIVATTAFATPRTGITGASIIPSGTIAQRPSGTTPFFRYNTELASPEFAYNGSWVQVLPPKSYEFIAIDGQTDFVVNTPLLSQTPLIFLNGVLQRLDITYSFGFANKTITFLEPRTAEDSVIVYG